MVLYIDMNAFFASVEQQRRPELRGKPVAVVSLLGDRGCVLAASYEAKARGLKTSMRLPEAYALCPGLICTETRIGPYKETHVAFMAILRDLCGPEVCPRSIDEAVVRLPPNWEERALELALEIKRRFRSELGEHIRCSIGIGPNVFLGKLATELKKPDGLVLITAEDVPGVLAGLQHEQLPGIAGRMARRLRLGGYETPLDLYLADPADLKAKFGIWGWYWHRKLHGLEADYAPAPMKTISSQHALAEWTYSVPALQPVLLKQAERLIHRLRRNRLRCLQLGVFVSLKGRRGLSLERDFDAPISDHASLTAGCRELWRSLPAVAPAPVRMVGLWMAGLSPAEAGLQLQLIGDRGRREDLSRALYAVQEKFGRESILCASSLRVRADVAEEKLGFGRVKDL